MTTVFVSYSRKDLAAAHPLVAALIECELETWIDWEDIPPTADWKDTIREGIESSDGFLFLLSPDSVQSKVCREECELAIRNGKRLIPVVVRDVNPDQVHAALAKINWIYCRQQDDFAKAIEKLLSAIRTDLEWVEFHRQLQVKALEWERGLDQSLLLRGKELQEVEERLAGAGQKDPQPTDLQRDYVLKSRQAADRQRRITTVISTVGIAILALLAVVAWVQAGRATASAQKEQAASTLAVSNAQMAQAASTLAVRNEMTAVANETEAKRQAQLALSRQLAAQSGSLLRENYPLALLLSAEAYNLSDTAQAQSSLLQGLQYNPQLLSLLRGHPGGITDAVFLGDRELLASADDLGRLILWDVSNPRAARPFQPPHTDITAVASLVASPDGKSLAYHDLEGTIHLWDVSDPDAPRAIQSIEGTGSLKLAFRENGTELISGSQDGTLTTWTRSSTGVFAQARQTRPRPGRAFFSDELLFRWSSFGGRGSCQQLRPMGPHRPGAASPKGHPVRCHLHTWGKPGWRPAAGLQPGSIHAGLSGPRRPDSSVGSPWENRTPAGELSLWQCLFHLTDRVQPGSPHAGSQQL